MINLIRFLFLIVSCISQAALSPKSRNIEGTIERKLHAAVVSELPENLKVHIENIFTKEPVPVEAEIFSIQPQPPLGTIHFEFQWRDKGISRQAFGNAVVKATGKIAVAKNPIRHGDTFNEENTRFEEKDVTKYRTTGYFIDFEKLSRLKANGFISPGTVVGFFQTQTPQAISAGQMVNLVYESRNLKVTAKVKALESGRVDQWIRLENPTSRKLIQGRVLPTGEVSIR